MLVLIKGAGDLATGTALRLHRAGLQVVLSEIEAPTAVRRTVSFSPCVYDGTAAVEGVTARRCDTAGQAQACITQGEIPVLTCPAEELLAALPFDAVVDAIVAKRNTGTRMGDAARVVALGPGFTAGMDCHAVVETMRGHDLGRVIWRGSAAPNTGVPGEVGGYAAERLLRAPRDGVFCPIAEIGQTVAAGETVATVDGAAVTAQIDGVLRGLLPAGLTVTAGMKAGDVDPRCDRSHCFTVSDKARAVGGGVLEALLAADPEGRVPAVAHPDKDGRPRLILCGGGHVSLALAKVADAIGFAVHVIDDRAEFVTAARFPAAVRRLALPFSEALDELQPGADDYVCILTRGHTFDSECAAQVLPAQCAYIGMIGSKGKVARAREGLLQAGFPAEWVDRLHAPIGLSIGAQTPEEIAVSIAAELIAARAARGGVQVRLPPGPGVEVVITAKRGSAPRGVGAAMLVRPDGSTAGTIGGGRVEHLAALAALELLKTGGTEDERTFDLSSEAHDPGMVCGGKVTVRLSIRPPQ